MEKLFNELSRLWKMERATTGMTLKKTIQRLKDLPRTLEMPKFEKFHSYRGYYSDLAVSSPVNMCTVEENLKAILEVLGKSYEGYKGGEFVMDYDTPVWIACYGKCGERLLGIDDDGTLITKTQE